MNNITLISCFCNNKEKLQVLKNNISKWWNSNQIKEIRNKWCSDYAYTNKYWKNEWSKFLIKI